MDDRQTSRSMGLNLVGKWIRFRHQPDGPDHWCIKVDRDGMVELFDMPGMFAPHLFIVGADMPAPTASRFAR